MADPYHDSQGKFTSGSSGGGAHPHSAAAVRTTINSSRSVAASAIDRLHQLSDAKQVDVAKAANNVGYSTNLGRGPVSQPSLSANELAGLRARTGSSILKK